MSTGLTGEWLDRWSARLTSVAGPRAVRRAEPHDLAALDTLRADTGICSEDLWTFYRHIGEVILPGDPALHLFPPSRVLACHREDGPVTLLHAHDPAGIVIGADRTETLYVQDWGGAIHRSSDRQTPGFGPDEWVVHTTRGGRKKYYDFAYVAESVADFLTLVLETARQG